MDGFSDSIVRHKKGIVIAFLVFALLGGILMSCVSVNFNMVDYLPQKAQSTRTLNVMEEEFKEKIPNTRVMIRNVTIREALKYKDEISRVEGVLSVRWLDDIVGEDILTTTPIEFIDGPMSEDYYKNGSALIEITVENGSEEFTIGKIRELIGEDNAVDGRLIWRKHRNCPPRRS